MLQGGGFHSRDRFMMWYKNERLESTRMVKGLARCGSSDDPPQSRLRGRVGRLSNHEYATHDRMEAALIEIAARREPWDRVAAVGSYETRVKGAGPILNTSIVCNGMWRSGWIIPTDGRAGRHFR